MSFNLHFIGIAAENWQVAFQYYTEKMGLNSPDQNPVYGNWALMGRNHDAYNNTSVVLKFELFDNGKTPSGGWEWGVTQGYRPGFFVDDLSDAMQTLQSRGIEFSSEIVSTRWGRHIEFKAAEGLRWTLEEAPELLGGNGDGFAEPNIGCVRLKSADLAAQKAFYHGLLGMAVLYEDDHIIALQRCDGEPYLFLEASGARGQKIERGYQQGYEIVDGQFALQGVWISFSVDDLTAHASRLRAAGVDILQDATVHDDWEGVDMLIRDPDGSIMQIVQYLY